MLSGSFLRHSRVVLDKSHIRVVQHHEAVFRIVTHSTHIVDVDGGGILLQQAIIVPAADNLKVFLILFRLKEVDHGGGINAH